MSSRTVDNYTFKNSILRHFQLWLCNKSGRVVYHILVSFVSIKTVSRIWRRNKIKHLENGRQQSGSELRTLHTESEIFACVFQFFHIPHPFLSKCMQHMWKCRKSNLIQFFYDGRKFLGQCVNVIDTMWGLIYLFFNVWIFLTKISDSVCNDL